MPTRTRLIVRTPGGSIYKGGTAVKTLVQACAAKNFLGLQLPPNWQELPKRTKLEWLAARMPQGYKLMLFQEPKETRKSRSLYWKTMTRGLEKGKL